MKRTPPPNIALRRERFRHQMSIATLAQRAGLSRNTVGEIERGHREPYFNTAVKIAAALDTDVDSIFSADRVMG